MKQGRKISIVSRMFAVLLAVMMVCSNISLPSKAAETVQTIAAWEYKDKDSAPSSLPAGATSGSGQLNVTGATYTGYSSKSLAANNWEEEGYWTISEINAEKYENLTFSASLRSSNTGAKNFQLEYSLDKGQSGRNYKYQFDTIIQRCETSGRAFRTEFCTSCKKSWDNKCERRYSCTDRSKQY